MGGRSARAVARLGWRLAGTGPPGVGGRVAEGSGPVDDPARAVDPGDRAACGVPSTVPIPPGAVGPPIPASAGEAPTPRPIPVETSAIDRVSAPARARFRRAGAPRTG